MPADWSRSPRPSLLPQLLGAQTYPTHQRSPEHAQARPVRRRHGGGEHATRLVLAQAGAVRLRARPDVHQLRHHVRHALRLSGQLRRLHDLGRERSGQAGASRRSSSASRRRATRPSVGNLLFISAEGAGNRNDCAKGGVQDPKDHMAGVRIFDVSNPHAPKLIKNVQTCKGSHTFTPIPSPTDKNILYLYISGQQAARPETEVPELHCKNGTDPADPTNSLYELDIIKVPLDHPENAKVIPGARIFTGLDPSPACTTFCAPVTEGGRGGRGGRGGTRRYRRRLGAQRRRRSAPARATATTSRRIRRCTFSSARARTTASWWTSRTPRSRCAWPRWPTPTTSRAGTRPGSATTARSSSSPTNGAAARRRCARPARCWRWAATRSSPSAPTRRS